MTRSWLWITCTLAAIALALTGWYMSNNSVTDTLERADDNEPTYQSQHTATLVYTPVGKLNYKLVAEETKNYAANGPKITLFDDTSTASWSVHADQAKLVQNKTLYLYGNIEVNNLNSASQLQKISTDSAQINLATQDVSSDDQVRLSGTGFTSTGMGMRGNLRNRTAELIEKVTTWYALQNQK